MAACIPRTDGEQKPEVSDGRNLRGIGQGENVRLPFIHLPPAVLLNLVFAKYIQLPVRVDGHNYLADISMCACASDAIRFEGVDELCVIAHVCGRVAAECDCRGEARGARGARHSRTCR